MKANLVMRLVFSALTLALLSASAAQAACPTFHITRSATLARDINGISLGMTLKEVQEVGALTHKAFDVYSLTVDGIDYEVEVSPLGRVFQIDSRQRLGRFSPDRAFAATLTEKLTEKYGKPDVNQLPGAYARWSITEPVDYPSVGTYPRTTHYFSAGLSSDGGEVVLVMMMQDFRILWQDEAKLNCDPARAGESKVRF